MTGFVAAKEAILDLFVTAWGVTTEITLDNETLNNPADNYVRLTIRHNDAAQETLGAVGNRKFTRLGSAFVQIFTPVDQGSQAADGFVATAMGIFEGVRISGTTVRFKDVIPREIGPDGKWYQVNVQADFEYDETK